ncbi:MAG TPA: hypothetical protein VIK59_07370 [Verrucomicrobiae bacterium]
MKQPKIKAKQDVRNIHGHINRALDLIKNINLPKLKNGGTPSILAVQELYDRLHSARDASWELRESLDPPTDAEVKQIINALNPPNRWIRRSG